MVLQVIMLDTERTLAALVYDDQQDPDAVLRDFADDTNAQGFRVVGMVQGGLGYLIERARDADTPVVIAVSTHRLADWTTFAGETEKLACERAALDAWWRVVSTRRSSTTNPDRSRPNGDADHR